MFGFNFGRKTFLGIDIGSSSLKVLELEMRSGKPYLSNYAWISTVNQSEIENEGKPPIDFSATITSSYLKKIIREARIKRKNAYVSIPAFEGLVTLIDFPWMPNQDMEQAIRFEAHKYIPIPLDEVALSWQIVEEKEEFSSNGHDNGGGHSEKRIKILLVAASKSRVEAYKKIVKNAGLKLSGMEIENIPMVSSLVGNDERNFIIIDIGFRICNIIYVSRGIIIINRNIDAGGFSVTKTISKGMNISYERAEMLKVSGKNFFGPESGVYFSTLDIISNEVSRILEAIYREKSNLNLEAIILSGGTANMTGLKEFFQKKFNLKVIVGNPFSRINYDKRLEPEIEKIKGRFSVCVGLALRALEESNIKK
jgi:type IV pilus assembly protein PilM